MRGNDDTTSMVLVQRAVSDLIEAQGCGVAILLTLFVMEKSLAHF